MPSELFEDREDFDDNVKEKSEKCKENIEKLEEEELDTIKKAP